MNVSSSQNYASINKKGASSTSIETNTRKKENSQLNHSSLSSNAQGLPDMHQSKIMWIPNHPQLKKHALFLMHQDQQ